MTWELTEELGDAICEQLAHGKSLTSICKQDRFPSYSTVMNWLGDEKHKAFLEKYTRARDCQADYVGEEILEIADDSTLPVDERRIKIDTRKWYAGKMKPKKYGDKLQQDVTVTGATKEQRDAAVAAALSADR